MLNDEFVTDTLKKLDFYKGDNLYFIGKIDKSGWKTLFECLNYTAALLSKDTFAIINYFEGNIGFIPLDFNKQAEPIAIEDKAVLLNKDEIESINFKPSFLAKKLIINTKNNKKISFTVESKNARITKHEGNLKAFIEKCTK